MYLSSNGESLPRYGDTRSTSTGTLKAVQKSLAKRRDAKPFQAKHAGPAKCEYKAYLGIFRGVESVTIGFIVSCAGREVVLEMSLVDFERDLWMQEFIKGKHGYLEVGRIMGSRCIGQS